MQEKLLNLQQVANFLELDVEEVKELVDRGTIPAYKIAGSFLRFNESEIEVSKARILEQARYLRERKARELSAREAKKRGFLSDELRDFLYFNDFYIISGILLIILFILIFKS